MASNVFGAKQFKPTAPDKGSFPLDHFGECKDFYRKFMRCLRENENMNSKCRQESKDYLGCRMDNNLMAKMIIKMSEGGGSETVLRRNLPGTKAGDYSRWKEEPFDEMDSTLAVQQYIQQTIRKDPKDVDQILNPPETQDEGVWKYEHLRQFCMELNGLAVKLQSECKPETCTQMTATEQWIFLCAAHKTPKECPAIDYTRHTLDGAACLLNSNKYFPSRISIKESSVAKLGSVCRRVYRIFSHAYFHHRQIFDVFENESHLCRRFTVFVKKYKLMTKDNLIVPMLDESGAAESDA